MQNSITQSASTAAVLLVMACASVALLAHQKAGDQDDNMIVQEFLTSGPTGVRTWEVFVGRGGAVCGSTVAPGLEPKNFVMRYQPAKVALDDGTPAFLELWAELCATPGTPAKANRGPARQLADVR